MKNPSWNKIKVLQKKTQKSLVVMDVFYELKFQVKPDNAIEDYWEMHFFYLLTIFLQLLLCK